MLWACRPGRWFFEVLRDFAFQIRKFFARQGTDLAQRGEVFLRALHVTFEKIGFPHVLMRTAVPRIERESAIIVVECEIELSCFAVSVAEVILDVGITGIASFGGRK